jgi:E3 SUMO-protein ligase NSE2
MPVLQTGRRRLHQGRASTARPSTARPNDIPAAALALPEPKPPVAALDEQALRELQAVSNCRDTAGLEEQIGKSLDAINKSTFAVNESVAQTRDAVERLSKRNRNGEQAVELRRRLAEMEEELGRLAEEEEEGVRGVVDLKAGIEDQRQSVGEVMARAGAASRNKVAEQARIREALERAGMEGEECGDVSALLDERGVENLVEAWKELKDARAGQYQALSAAQRYARDNDYIAWKNQWHEGLELGVPNPRTWFAADGKPVIDFGEDAELTDDDLVVAGEVVDTKCPVSLVEISEPYTSGGCHHTFQKEGILQYLDQASSKACPVSGCTVSPTSRAAFSDSS